MSNRLLVTECVEDWHLVRYQTEGLQRRVFIKDLRRVYLRQTTESKPGRVFTDWQSRCCIDLQKSSPESHFTLRNVAESLSENLNEGMNRETIDDSQ